MFFCSLRQVVTLAFAFGLDRQPSGHLLCVCIAIFGICTHTAHKFVPQLPDLTEQQCMFIVSRAKSVYLIHSKQFVNCDVRPYRLLALSFVHFWQDVIGGALSKIN